MKIESSYKNNTRMQTYNELEDQYAKNRNFSSQEATLVNQ